MDDLLPPELALDEEPFDDETLDDLTARMAEIGVVSPFDLPEPEPAADGLTPAQRGVTLSAADVRVGAVQRWRITDDNLAEWAMRKYAQAQHALAELDAKHDAWQAQIVDWHRRAVAGPQRRAAFFEAHLIRYALEQRRDLDRKTVALPAGKVGTRAHAAKVDVADETAVLRWAREAGLAEKIVTEKVALTPLREHVVLAEIVDAAALLLSDGVVIGYSRGVGFDALVTGACLSIALAHGSGDRWSVRCFGEHETLPGVGDAIEHHVDVAPDGEPIEALVGRVWILSTHLEPQFGGVVVPGVEIVDATVTASVKPT